ncbi:TolC family protein [Hymenobacter sublimis]|uniref:TolC family protein n=1 Tax=Hymenobacter sublimis TaxID=2933777 RepID=A0ABY4JCQ7_9BACT|nr:TolC family protein [Hymenobacter sublimis]UPL50578.1 TolC family protein [Hymenobacter sublimis]
MQQLITQRQGAPGRLGSLLVLLAVPALAQSQPSTLSLNQVIELALSQSAAAKQTQTTRDKSYWEWRTYQANYKPQLGLQGTLPGFSRVITPVVQPDGTTDFRAVRINNSNLALSVSQNIGLTGGQIFVASEVQRFDDFNGGLKRYNNQPVAIGLTQPLGMFNGLKWARRIEPLRYQESQRQYLEEREGIAQRITELYFDVLQEQVNAEVASQNVQANEELLRIGKELYQLGRLSQSDLLRLELNLLNARQAMAQGRLDAQNAAVNLQSYTGLRADALRLVVPAAAPRLVVPAEQALSQARENRSQVLAFRRRLLLAEREVALARGTTGFQATLAANLGYVNQAGNLWDTYAALQNQQQVRLTFALPLVDWGKQKSIVKTAELTRRQVQTDVAQEEASFEQSVQVQATQLATLSEQLDLAARADSLAQRRYDIAQATYKVGRISLTDLTIASAEKDQARRTYILALRAAWVAHYRLRALTLYDFERQLPLTAQ